MRNQPTHSRHGSPMNNDSTFKPLYLRPVTFGNGGESRNRFHNGWHEPLLDLYSRPVLFPPTVPELPKLYLIPKPDELEGEEADSEYPRKPSHLQELPNLDDWVGKYVVSVIEIFGGKRPLQQLARWSHRSVYSQLAAGVASWKPLPKIRKLYIGQPLEGIAEVTVTLRFQERVRSLALRFEGTDKRWICTELLLV